MQINERKLSRFNNKYLDVFENNKIYLTYTYLDLCYMKSLRSMNEDKIDNSYLFPRHLSFRIKGITIFHEFALNYQLLITILEEINKIDEQQQSLATHYDIMDYQRISLLNLLYPNFYNNNAFDIAMFKKSPRSIEVMLLMLSKLPHFSISKWIMPHFQELLTMDLKAFDEFMATSLFQMPKMREVQLIKWPYPGDQHYIDFHTAYLGNYFLSILQKKDGKYHLEEQGALFEDEDEQESHPETTHAVTGIQTEDFTMFELVDGKGNESTFKGKQLKVENANSKKRRKSTGPDISFDKVSLAGQMKRVEFHAVEYDWIFKGEMAVKFIHHLASTRNDKLFSNPIIKIIILFLWDKFYPVIRNRVFIPFIFYFFCFVIMATLIQVQRDRVADILNGIIIYDFGDDDSYTQENLDQLNSLFIYNITLAFLGWSYFLYIEIRQLMFFRLQYFKQIWNILDVA